MGFDAAKEEYVNMVEAGILDPVKVTRSALQNATSVASTLTDHRVCCGKYQRGCTSNAGRWARNGHDVRISQNNRISRKYRVLTENFVNTRFSLYIEVYMECFMTSCGMYYYIYSQKKV